MHSLPPIVETMSLALPLITIVTALPLVFRIVPPNWFYGFRTRKTLSDSNIWYEANYVGGVSLLVASALTLAARWMLIQMFDRGVGIALSMVVLAITTIAALIISMAQVSKM